MLLRGAVNVILEIMSLKIFNQSDDNLFYKLVVIKDYSASP